MLNSKFKIRNSKFGFTLIELLVVISIIGILATLVTANLNAARSRARDAQRKSDVKNTQTALRLYFNDHGVYPAASGGGNILGCGAGGKSLCPWGSPFVNGGASCSDAGATCYMSALPKDPSGQSYFYQQGTDTDSYTLSACLENTSDTSGKTISISGWTCSTDWVFQVSQ